jgi:hypothetical protein
LTRARLPAKPSNVETVFSSYPQAVAAKLNRVRRLIFETAAATTGVGALTETLKWGEPAYLTEETGIGSTIRLGWPRNQSDRCAVYFNCRTSLVSTFREMFAGELTFVGERAIVLDVTESMPTKPLTICLSLALTYHRDKRRRAGD